MTDFQSFMLTFCFSISVGTVIGNTVVFIDVLRDYIKYRKRSRKDM